MAEIELKIAAGQERLAPGVTGQVDRLRRHPERGAQHAAQKGAGSQPAPAHLGADQAGQARLLVGREQVGIAGDALQMAAP